MQSEMLLRMAVFLCHLKKSLGIQLSFCLVWPASISPSSTEGNTSSTSPPWGLSGNDLSPQLQECTDVLSSEMWLSCSLKTIVEHNWSITCWTPVVAQSAPCPWPWQPFRDGYTTPKGYQRGSFKELWLKWQGQRHLYSYEISKLNTEYLPSLPPFEYCQSEN